MDGDGSQGIGGIGALFQIKLHGEVVAEADDSVSARLRAKEVKRLHRGHHVSVYDRTTRTHEPID